MFRLPSLSLRFRLTLLYTAILAATFVVFGAVVYRTVGQATTNAAQAAITSDATKLAALAASPGGVSALLAQAAQLYASAGLVIQIRQPDGTVEIGTPNFKGVLPLDNATLNAVQNGTSVGPTTVSVNGQSMLLYTVPVIHFDNIVAIVQVAESMQDVNRPLDSLRVVLLVGSGLAMILAFVVGWLLAGTALRPINRITRTARAIGEAQDFGQRVAYRGPTDEVGRLATTFNAMLARLQDAYQAQRRFVADASHELRTPLTSIRGNLGLLQREPPIDAADRVAVLADLVAESERLSRLVSDLLTLARSDAGRALRHEPVRVAPLVADLCRQLRPLHPDKTLADETPPDLAVLGDPDALTQVLLILLDNALKFTPPGGTITAMAAAHGERVAIAVRDTGSGIAPEALPHIFERFYQADTARAGLGTGLGLAIARALVEGQGGTIGVESQPGQGSVFTVTLPRATVPDEPVAAASGALSSPALPPSTRS